MKLSTTCDLIKNINTKKAQGSEIFLVPFDELPKVYNIFIIKYFISQT